MTDSAGNLVASYRYDPYGNTFATTCSVTNPWRFVGEYRQNQTNANLYKVKLARDTAGRLLITVSAGIAALATWDTPLLMAVCLVVFALGAGDLARRARAGRAERECPTGERQRETKRPSPASRVGGMVGVLAMIGLGFSAQRGEWVAAVVFGGVGLLSALAAASRLRFR